MKSNLQVATCKEYEEGCLYKISCSELSGYPWSLLYILMASASNSAINVARYERVTTTNEPTSEIIHLKNDEYSSYPSTSNAFELATSCIIILHPTITHRGKIKKIQQQDDERFNNNWRDELMIVEK